MPDVTIIGGGPAGSVAAVALERRGWDVTLFEQGQLPRDKVCGECLSALGIDVLRRLGLFERVEALGPVPLRRTVIISPDGGHASLELPDEIWGLSRVALDGALLHAARGAGADVRERHRCETLEPGDGSGGVAIRVRDLRDNSVRETRASHVLVADGKAATGLRRRPGPTGDFGVKAHFVNVAASPDAVLLLGVRGHYVGIAPVEGRRWNVAMNVPGERLRAARGDLDALFASMMHENRALDRLFARAGRVGDWLTSPLPRFAVTDGWPDRVIPVGNAAAALEPIGGEGMGLAMRSAELAAEAMDRAARAKVPIDGDALRRQFRRLWQLRRVACRAAAVALSCPPVADAGLAMFADTRLAALAARWMGK